jgi:hypothetical protein
LFSRYLEFQTMEKSTNLVILVEYKTNYYTVLYVYESIQGGFQVKPFRVLIRAK